MIRARGALAVALILGACGPSGGAPDTPPFSVPVVTWSRVPARDKLSPGLQRFVQSNEEMSRRVLVDLATQLDLYAMGRRLDEAGTPRAERRRLMIAALTEVADSSQARLAPALAAWRAHGWIDSSRGFVVVNRLLVVARSRGVRALAERDDVHAIVEETEAGPPILMAPGQTGVSERSWALDAIGVESARRRGLDGRGIVVGIIDAGASASHEQLRDNYRGGAQSWHDPIGARTLPRDGVLGHGTGILSVAVGRQVAGRRIGVAPGADWVACAGMPDARFNNVAFTECADWMLRVAQPDVLINAWVLPDTGCALDARPIVEAWRLAEILPVFAAGNYGPAGGSGRSPANYVGLYPGTAVALAVGAVTRSGAAYERSSRGPGGCGGDVYPSLVAPGAGVTVAFPLSPTTYTEAAGSSIAAGYVAGAAALLLQAYPAARVWEVEQALRTGTRDRGTPGPDDTYGYGVLDVGLALDALGRLRTNVAANSTIDATTHR